MVIEKDLVKYVDKQFEMIGEKVRIKDIPSDGIITINGKKMYWYEYYKWDSMEDYEKWKDWMRKELELIGNEKLEYVLNYTDFRYGLVVRYKKEGAIF